MSGVASLLSVCEIYSIYFFVEKSLKTWSWLNPFVSFIIKSKTTKLKKLIPENIKNVVCTPIIYNIDKNNVTNTKETIRYKKFIKLYPIKGRISGR